MLKSSVHQAHDLPAPRRFMAKIKTARGFRFVKELGGAIRHDEVSFAARWLVDNHRIQGRVLDYGCGHGFDADHFGWCGYDPYYRQQSPGGTFDTVVCNHVLNMLTRRARTEAIDKIQNLLADDGVAWLAVPRNIPKTGKLGTRKRIQNYVVLDLLSCFSDAMLEIYRMTKETFDDYTQEIELRL